MRKFALSLLYLAGALMLIGGIGDQFINELLNVHINFLGNPPDSELFDRSQALILLMLHSLGGGLISTGISMLALTHFGIRRGLSWSKWTYLIIAWIAQGFNGYGMYMAGSYFYYPLAILLLSSVGVLLYRDENLTA
jgi:hypothetical protein